jgi:hypothetical protein
MSPELSTEQTTGQQLVRLWQESRVVEQQADTECHNFEAVRFGTVEGSIKEANAQAFVALQEQEHVNRKLRSFVRSLIGEQVLIQPLDEDGMVFKDVSSFGLCRPIKEGPSWSAEKVSGLITMGSVPVRGRDSLCLRRNGLRSLFRLPKEYAVDILNPKTGEPQVEITVGAI